MFWATLTCLVVVSVAFPQPDGEEGPHKLTARRQEELLELLDRIEVEVIPPKYHPGQLTKVVDDSKLNNALDDVLRAGTYMQNRRCAIAVVNDGGATLVTPRFYVFGHSMSHATPPPAVHTEESALLLFTKKEWRAEGVLGVVTYDIEGTNYCIAILFDVAELKLSKNSFVVKVYPKSVNVNKALFQQMWHYGGRHYPGGWTTRNEFGVRITASMTDGHEVKYIVHLDTHDFSESIGPTLFAYCDYHAWKVGRYCRVEKYPMGSCYTGVKCRKNGDADCQRDLPCIKDW